MLARRAGTIVAVGSMAVKCPAPGQATYAATKVGTIQGYYRGVQGIAGVLHGSYGGSIGNCRGTTGVLQVLYMGAQGHTGVYRGKTGILLQGKRMLRLPHYLPHLKYLCVA